MLRVGSMQNETVTINNSSIRFWYGKIFKLYNNW